MAYGMGQFRYSSSETICSKDTDWAGGHFFKGNTTMGYKDYRIMKTSNGNPSPIGSDIYLLHCKIARNSTYDMIFDLKLCGTTNGITNGQDFQNIKRFTVGKDALGGNSIVPVMLFENYSASDDTNPTRVAMIANYDKPFGKGTTIGSDWDHSKIYRGIINGEEIYYYYSGSTNDWIEIHNYNLQFISESWKQNNSTDKYAYFDFIIKDNLLNSSSSTNTHNTIVFEMVRQDWDSDIVNKNDEEDDFFGLVANIEWEIYKLTNILNIIDLPIGTSLSTIGVWGRPDLIMAINGEEIRIGPSGYYELTDFDIKSFCVAATSDKDRFTLDYQYQFNEQD